MYQRIRFLREKYNFSIYDISQKLNITFNLYMQYENGKKEVPVAILSKIAKIYNTSIDSNAFIVITDAREVYGLGFK